MWLKLVHHAIINQMCIHKYISTYLYMCFLLPLLCLSYTLTSVIFDLWCWSSRLQLTLVYSRSALNRPTPFQSDRVTVIKIKVEVLSHLCWHRSNRLPTWSILLHIRKSFSGKVIEHWKVPCDLAALNFHQYSWLFTFI